MYSKSQYCFFLPLWFTKKSTLENDWNLKKKNNISEAGISSACTAKENCVYCFLNRKPYDKTHITYF